MALSVKFLGSTTLCLFISAVGAGLLSYPVAYRNQGIFFCVFFTLLFAYLIYTASLTMVQVAHLFKKEMVNNTFEELHYRALGYRFWAIGTSSVLVGVFGALVGFTIVIGDMLSPVLDDAFPDSVWSSRPFILFTVTLCVALPLSTIEHIHSLYLSSALSVASVLVVAVAVGFQANASLNDCPAAFSTSTFAAPANSDDDTTASTMPLVIFRLNAPYILLGIPISVFSLSSSTQVVPLFLELPSDQYSVFPIACCCSLASCVLLYLSTGFLGYLSFRDATAGDVLTNFPATGTLSNLARSLLGIHVLLAYPLLLWPARRCIQSLLRPSSGASSAPSSPPPPPSPFAVALGLVLSSTALAVLVPEVSVVFGLVGSIVGSWQALIFPGFLMTKWGEASIGRGGEGGEKDEPLLPSGLYAETADLKEVGPYNDLYSPEKRRAVWQTVGSKDFDGRLFLTRSGRYYVLFGRGLIAIGFVLMVLGTADYVWATWL